MFDIVSLGEILIDLTQTGKNEQNIPVYAANPGGAPANVAGAASKLGAKTAFCGMVGKWIWRIFERNIGAVSGFYRFFICS